MSGSMSQKIAALTARVNEKATTDTARWTYEGSVPFVDLGTAALGAGEVPHVHRFRLGNGLKVLVLVDRSAPVMSYFTWFRVGSRHEKPGKTGLAHLFEHLMFNESEGVKAASSTASSRRTAPSRTPRRGSTGPTTTSLFPRTGSRSP